MEFIDQVEALEKLVEFLKEDSDAKTYIRVVDLDERGSYRAHVEDEDGNVVFSYSNEEDELDDEGEPTGNKIEGELWLTTDGFMEHSDDLAGLERYLKSNKFISRDSELVDQGQNESQGEHAPLVTEEDDEEETENYENHLSNENLERFVDGLLTVLGELELEGQVPAINTPQQSRDALLAVVRRLYIKKSTVAKMSRKFARFGAKRFLRKQKTAIGKAVSSE